MPLNAEQKNYHSYVRTIYGCFQDVKNTEDNICELTMSSELPPTNIIETDRCYEIQVAAPGFHRDDFTVKMNDDILCVEGKPGTHIDNVKRIVKEQFVVKGFKCNMLMPEDIREEKMQSNYKHGILSIIVPKLKA